MIIPSNIWLLRDKNWIKSFNNFENGFNWLMNRLILYHLMHFHGMVFNFWGASFTDKIWKKQHLFWTPSKAYLSAISKIQKLPLPHENYLQDDLPDWVDDYGSLQGIIPIADLLQYKYEGRSLSGTLGVRRSPGMTCQLRKRSNWRKLGQESYAQKESLSRQKWN